MGLEYTGYTPGNIEELWIDPHDYEQELEEAVQFLALRNMPLSIYNHQLCTLPPSLWRYARKSISDWKQLYLPQCDGFFQWAVKKHSAHIQPCAPPPAPCRGEVCLRPPKLSIGCHIRGTSRRRHSSASAPTMRNLVCAPRFCQDLA